MLLKSALSRHEVGARKSLDFKVLQSAVPVVEAFRPLACRSSQVFERLELPVSPARQVGICNFRYLSDFLGAGSISKTRSEFSDHQRETQTVCVLSSSSDSLVVPCVTFIN